MSRCSQHLPARRLREPRRPTQHRYASAAARGFLCRLALSLTSFDTSGLPSLLRPVAAVCGGTPVSEFRFTHALSMENEPGLTRDLVNEMARSVVWLEVGGRVGVTGLGRDCVGVIISPSRVLTAAACFFPGDPTRATSPSASPKGTTGAATAGTPYNKGTSVLKSFNVQVVAGSLLQELGRDGVRTHLWDTLLKTEGVLIDDARLQAHRFDFYTRGVQVDDLVEYWGNGIVVVDFAKYYESGSGGGKTKTVAPRRSGSGEEQGEVESFRFRADTLIAPLATAGAQHPNFYVSAEDKDEVSTCDADDQLSSTENEAFSLPSLEPSSSPTASSDEVDVFSRGVSSSSCSSHGRTSARGSAARWSRTNNRVPVRAVAIGVVEDRKPHYCGDGPGTRGGDPGSDSEEELLYVDRVLGAAIEKKRAETAKSSRSSSVLSTRGALSSDEEALAASYSPYLNTLIQVQEVELAEGESRRSSCCSAASADSEDGAGQAAPSLLRRKWTDAAALSSSLMSNLLRVGPSLLVRTAAALPGANCCAKRGTMSRCAGAAGVGENAPGAGSRQQGAKIRFFGPSRSSLSWSKQGVDEKFLLSAHAVTSGASSPNFATRNAPQLQDPALDWFYQEEDFLGEQGDAPLRRPACGSSNSGVLSEKGDVGTPLFEVYWNFVEEKYEAAVRGIARGRSYTDPVDFSSRPPFRFEKVTSPGVGSMVTQFFNIGDGDRPRSSAGLRQRAGHPSSKSGLGAGLLSGIVSRKPPASPHIKWGARRPSLEKSDTVNRFVDIEAVVRADPELLLLNQMPEVEEAEAEDPAVVSTRRPSTTAAAVGPGAEPEGVKTEEAVGGDQPRTVSASSAAPPKSNAESFLIPAAQDLNRQLQLPVLPLSTTGRTYLTPRQVGITPLSRFYGEEKNIAENTEEAEGPLLRAMRELRVTPQGTPVILGYLPSKDGK